MPELAFTDAELDRLAVVRVPALLSVGTVARLLDCSARTVRRRIAEGSLPAVIDPGGRLMIRGDELAEFVEALDRPNTPARRRRRARSHDGRFDFLRE